MSDPINIRLLGPGTRIALVDGASADVRYPCARHPTDSPRSVARLGMGASLRPAPGDRRAETARLWRMEARRFQTGGQFQRIEWALGHIAISLVAGGCSCVLGSAACRLGLFPISPVEKPGRR